MARSLCALALALAPGHGVFAQKLGFAVAPPVGLPLYDCKAEYYMWETAWTPEWKAWCCAHENRGCPSTTTTTRTTTTATTTSKTATSTSTETVTETKTSTSTETATVTSTSTRTQTSSSSTMTTTPWPTRTFTSTVTASTTETATESTTTEAPTTTTATTTTKDLHDMLAKMEKCDASCEFEGQVHTCSERVVFAAEHLFNKEANPCEAAHVSVLSQCSACGYCTRQQACEEVQGDSMMVARLARKFMAQKSGSSAAASAADIREEDLRPFRVVLACGAGTVALLAVLRAGFSWTGRHDVHPDRRILITEDEAAFQE